MGKTKSKDDKRDKFKCPKCGHPCVNKGALAKHRGSKACKRRQMQQKALKGELQKKKEHAKTEKRSKRNPRREQKKTPKVEELPKAREQAGALTTLPPAPASDTPEIPDEMSELREFTQDLGKNLREEERSRIIPRNDELPHEEIPTEGKEPEAKTDLEPGSYNPRGEEKLHTDLEAQKRDSWPWIVGGVVLLGGLIFAAKTLLRRQEETEAEEVATTQAKEEISEQEPDPNEPVDPWDERIGI